MKVLTPEHIVYTPHKTDTPATEMVPGEVMRVETYDARRGTIRSDTDLMGPHDRNICNRHVTTGATVHLTFEEANMLMSVRGMFRSASRAGRGVRPLLPGRFFRSS